MSDLISRQAAIDAICKACSMEEDYHKCDGYPETSTWCDELVALRALPSAQPEVTEEAVKEYCRKRCLCIVDSALLKKYAYAQAEVPDTNVGDMISRQAAIDALARMMPHSYTPDGSHPADEEIFRAQEVFVDCIEALEILPSAQPEIVRCGQCKYAEVADAQDNQDGYTCQFHRGSIWFSGSYCSWGERKSDEQV